MSNYIPHYSKKQQILRKKELKLLRLLSKNASGDRLLVAAADVRAAKIRALVAALTSPESSRGSNRIVNLRNKIAIVTATSVDTVLEGYRQYGQYPPFMGMIPEPI